VEGRNSGYPGLIVRDVRWSDFEDLREMYYGLYEERERGEPIGITLFRERPSLADEVEWFSQAYRRVLAGDEVLSVAEVDGRAVGNCAVTRSGPSRSSEVGHVGNLGILVDAPYRGQGIGTALMRHAIAQCRGKFEVIRLTVFSVNEGAQRLYRRFGFAPCGHRARAVRRGTAYYDEEEMVLFLDRPAEPAAKG
jgi:RimJ/RimL family protein N-acetyltransferase